MRVWPAIFPDGRCVRASVLETPRAHLAHVSLGTLSVDTEWLPQEVKLFVVGVYLRDMRMRLPRSNRSSL
jgi:hypothetical protein